MIMGKKNRSFARLITFGRVEHVTLPSLLQTWCGFCTRGYTWVTTHTSSVLRLCAVNVQQWILDFNVLPGSVLSQFCSTCVLPSLSVKLPAIEYRQHLDLNADDFHDMAFVHIQIQSDFKANCMCGWHCMLRVPTDCSWLQLRTSDCSTTSQLFLVSAVRAEMCMQW